MNAPTRVDYGKAREGFKQESYDFRAHYEGVAASVLLSIARHKLFITFFVVFVMASASMIIPLLPRKYSAEALIYPNLFSADGGKAVALASVDAASIVSSEARLIRSDAILRAVAKRLGLDQVAAEPPSSTSSALRWVRAMFLPETLNHSPFDRAVSMLRNHVGVVSDTRSYLISVSFTAPSAAEAARVVNAFAFEYLRDKALQRKRDALAAAENEVGRELAIYGEKHPKVLRAMEGLDAARTDLNGTMDTNNSGPDSVVTGETVKLATLNQTPTSPKGFTILGLSFVLALPTAIALVVWRDRRSPSGQRRLADAEEPLI